jgi:tripartite-type tricarboxylate transporter receptor subunit TctC
MRNEAFRRLLLAVFASAVVLPAWAQPVWPDRPITIIVPAAAAGPTDAVSRLVADQLRKSLGVAVVVENKPGAGGNVGATHVAKAAPDGYTLLMATIGTHAVNRTLYTTLPFDPEKDFEPVSQVVSYPLVVAVRNDLPVKNAAELVAYAKANPGKLNRGSGGSGTSMHLSGEYFNSMAGIKMTHIPYKGSAPALTDLLSGQLDLVFDTILTVAPQMKTGKIRVIGITSDTRSPIVPDAAPLSETVPGYSMASWIGIVAPKGTPQPVVNRLQQDIARALQQPEVKEKLAAQGAQPVGSSPDKFREFMKQETARWAKVVRDSGARAD